MLRQMKVVEIPFYGVSTGRDPSTGRTETTYTDALNLKVNLQQFRDYKYLLDNTPSGDILHDYKVVYSAKKIAFNAPQDAVWMYWNSSWYQMYSEFDMTTYGPRRGQHYKYLFKKTTTTINDPDIEV